MFGEDVTMDDGVWKKKQLPAPRKLRVAEGR